MNKAGDQRPPKFRHPDYIRAVVYSPCGNFITSGDDTGAIIIRDIGTLPIEERAAERKFQANVSDEKVQLFVLTIPYKHNPTHCAIESAIPNRTKNEIFKK